MKEILPAVVGVDLGASFTKISFRPPWTEDSDGNSYRQRSSMIVIEGSTLVPSLMIYSARHERWLAGQEAANYHPTPEDRVFSNWKRSLYSEQHDHKVDGDMDAATQFFSWLGKNLGKIDIGLKECAIKICLPAFKGAERSAKLLLERMTRCGWAGRSHLMISEPSANAIGIFGHGNNAANRFEDNTELQPHYLGNFPDGGLIIKHLRDHALTNGPRYTTFILFDIGSFTADISVCTIDAKRSGDCLHNVIQHSFQLGLVDHYEVPLFEQILTARNLIDSDLTFFDRERIKSALNVGKQLRVAVPDGTSVTFGTSTDVELAEKIAKKYAERLGKTISIFLDSSIPKYCVLTGGGTSISVLQRHLVSDLKQMGIWVLDSHSAAPVEPTERQSGTTCIDWELSEEALERQATALGASSVLLDLPAHESENDSPNRTTRSGAWHYCTCNGSNKDCVKCGGLGIVVRGQ